MIRRATLNDLPQLSQLFDSYRIFYKRSTDLAGARAFLEKRLHAEDSIIFVSEGYEGFAQMYPSYSSLAMKPLWILNDLFVTESARRKDVARHLITACEKFALEDGARGLTLQTAKDNIPAQKLYSKLNWLKDEKFQTYLRVFDQ